MGPKMPVSCENSDSAISSSIRDSLGNYNGITKSSNLGIAKNQLSAALKQTLLKPIEYVESPPGFGYSIQETLKAKYTVLRPSEEEKTTTAAVGGSTSQLSKLGNGTKLNGASLPSPKVVLFPRDKVQIGWGNARKWSVGSGMVNLGNTCYLNSTLQALFHVPSFANWLQSDSDHRSRCEELSGSQHGCIICSMADVLQSTQSSQCPTKPIQVYSKLKHICRHLVHGHQEDAHEFLRYLMESMEKAFLARYKNSKEFEQYTKETTPINQILGGYLRTTVKCLSCQYESVTFQHFEDLLLDIRRVSTIEEALKYHFARERLEEMDYTCESCKRKVSATKQFSLERAPVALCIQLKRFSGINGKISKHINISPYLDFSQYSSRDMKNSKLKYRLVSVITHLGSTPQCGHYTAVGCCQDGSYYQFDDSSVRSMSNNSMLNINPYIIFYELVPSSKPLATSPPMVHTESSNKQTETSTLFIGPLLPMTSALNKPVLSPVVNGCATKPYASSTSNGFVDSRKLATGSNNQMTPQRKINDTASSAAITKLASTNGSTSNETLTKHVDKNWTTVSEPLPSNVNTSNSLPMRDPQRITEPTNKSCTETVTKKSSDDSRSSSDSESEMPSTPKLATLPSMPELKSNSQTALQNGNVTPSTNGIRSTDTGDSKQSSDNGNSLTPNKESVAANSSARKLHSTLDHKGTVAVYVSPAKTHSPINQPKCEANRKLVALTYRESAESENKIRSPSLPVNSSRQTLNPFSKNIAKNGKHKPNGHHGHHHSTYNQRTTKPTNGYVVSPRKSLVPYVCHDDSDSNDDDRNSPPMVKTKAGPFQVTKNTTNGNNNGHRVGDARMSWSKSSNGGRVPSLNTWNGSTSILQDEILNEQRENKKRKLYKDFDQDIDVGRMKKKRSNGHNGDRDNPNYNAFQEHQNRSRGPPQRHHRRNNNNNNNNNKKNRFFSLKKFMHGQDIRNHLQF
ncbi:hypothetical protein HA402_003303 [Bradysia odoriphaga]|nr:hypothetical protein HA402_003303 [Bradysia odoriphaga]